MPYFYNNNINILFIHIPKTGGSSVENYFSIKYKIILNDSSFFNFKSNNDFTHQHKSLKELLTISFYKSKINFKNLKIMSIVRNPYDRIISDLFFTNLINILSTPEEVLTILKNDYFKNYNDKKYDNHKKPQYLFLLDLNNKINKNIIILKTETLNKDMKKLGFFDFNYTINVSEKNDTMTYLNSESINLINKYYYYDFILFGYTQL